MKEPISCKLTFHQHHDFAWSLQFVDHILKGSGADHIRSLGFIVQEVCYLHRWTDRNKIGLINFTMFMKAKSTHSMCHRDIEMELMLLLLFRKGTEWVTANDKHTIQLKMNNNRGNSLELSKHVPYQRCDCRRTRRIHSNPCSK